MKQFEDRLLTELQQLVVAAPVQRRRPRWAFRLAPVAGLAAALAIGVTTFGGVNPTGSAYAVEDNGDGTVTVKVYTIRDPKGLERQIEDKTGIPASVHYLPQDRLCAPPWYDDRMAGRKQVHDSAEDPTFHELRGKVRISEAEDGAFVFTIDNRDIPDGWSLVVISQDDWAEHGQPTEKVASIHAGFEKGENLDDCRLIDGSIEGWGFQQGAPPTSDRDKEEHFAEYKGRHPEGSPGA